MRVWDTGGRGLGRRAIRGGCRRRSGPASRSLSLCVLLLTLVFGAAGQARSASPEAPDFQGLIAELVALGPRPPGSQAHGAARRLLLQAMEDAGLAQVEVMAAGEGPSVRHLQGILPGDLEEEILLLAHYDTAAHGANEGGLDNASGCGVVLAAVSDLVRTPLRHTVRVVLFDGEAPTRLGSRAWLQGLDAGWRDRVLAALHVEGVGLRRSSGAVLHSLPVRSSEGETTLAPGWLVHALLRSGEAAGWPLAMTDARFSMPGQLLLRSARVRGHATGDNLLEAGIPAATVSDRSLRGLLPPRPGAAASGGDPGEALDENRLRSWVRFTAASVRRLDSLAGRPRPEDEFLVLAGRVWIRRDLIWGGLLLWIVLVFRGRPGSWRGESTETRRARGRGYLPGFVFRALFVVTMLAAPVHATFLVYPLAPLVLLRPLARERLRLWQALGLFPLVVWMGMVLAAAAAGLLASFDLGVARLGLLAATPLSYVWQLQAEASQGQGPAQGDDGLEAV